MGTRLTDVERRERALSERDFQRQVTDLATALGWSWCHWRALRNGRGIWQVPVEGPLGKGWPDLTLIRVRDRRLLFVELKRELEEPSADQTRVIEQLEAFAWPRCDCSGSKGGLADWQLFGSQVVDGVRHDPGCTLVSVYHEHDPRLSVHVWRPSMLRDPIESSPIYEVLR